MKAFVAILSMLFLGGCAQPIVAPPRAFIDMVMGDPHGPRFRSAVDSQGRDCNDYAWDAAKAHHARLAAVYDELGEGHMIAVADDGIAFDNRANHPISWNSLRALGYRGVEIQTAYGSMTWERF